MCMFNSDNLKKWKELSEEGKKKKENNKTEDLETNNKTS